MRASHTLIRIFRRLLKGLADAEDNERGEEILKEIMELVPGLINKCLNLINKQEFNFLVQGDYDSKSSFKESLAIFYEDTQNSYASLGFCSCQNYIDSVLLREECLTCEHELAVVIICYLLKIFVKNTEKQNDIEGLNQFVQKVSEEKYLEIANTATEAK